MMKRVKFDPSPTIQMSSTAKMAREKKRTRPSMLWMIIVVLLNPRADGHEVSHPLAANTSLASGSHRSATFYVPLTSSAYSHHIHHDPPSPSSSGRHRRPQSHTYYRHGSSPLPMHSPSLPSVPYALEPVHPNPDVALANVIAEKLLKNQTKLLTEFTKQSKKHNHNHQLLSSPGLSLVDHPETHVNKHKGLLTTGTHLQNPFYLSPQDPLLSEDPMVPSPVLMDLMHFNADGHTLAPFGPNMALDDQAYFDESLFAKYPLVYDPQMKNPYEDIDHLHHDDDHDHDHDHPAPYYHHHDHPNSLPTSSSYHLHTHDTDNSIDFDMVQEHPSKTPMAAGESSKRPAAQSMLFAKHYNYYTPFKVNTINVYAKYLSHGNDKCKRSKSGGKLSSHDIEAAMKKAGATVNWYRDTVVKNGQDTKRRTPYIPSGVLDAKLFEYASVYLKKRFVAIDVLREGGRDSQRKCYTKMDVVKMMPKLDSRKYVSRYNMPVCKSYDKIVCNPKSKYRTIDGSCNNLKMKTWARSFTCHRRLLPPDYADGVSAPRVAYDGSRLPNARDVSSLLLPDISVSNHKLTSMVMSFGQFIVHDIARTIPFSNDIKCCPTKKAVHPECFAIDINQKDDFLTKTYNQTCLNFVRSTICNACSLGPREQQNQATHTFDMSHMYGLVLNDSMALRTLRGGKMRSSWTSTYPKAELPPKMKKDDPNCNVRPYPPRFKCFESSDGIRASQHPALQALHTAFHRRHNQHAQALAKVNRHWNDEKLYQESRRITIAEQSMITYNEYVTSIFGKKLADHFRLGVSYKGFTKYDHKLNPNTIQEFIVAAGRFGHSQINDQFKVMFEDKKMSYSFSLRDNFFETTIVSLGHSGGILKGLAMESTEATDPYFVDDIKNFLYKLRREKLGRDLPAFNIQRGRDHGIPGYVYYLDFCFGFKVKSWKDLITFIPKKQLKKIQVFYKHYKDIDLFVGGISERLISGAAFGPTFACINGIQFYNWKYGDRFYFEHGYQAGSFTSAQLDNIRKVSSLSQVICKTNTEIKYMAANSFLKPSPHYNPIKACHSFEEINYALWKDKKDKYDDEHSMPKPVFKTKTLEFTSHEHRQHQQHSDKPPSQSVHKYHKQYSHNTSPESDVNDEDFLQDETRPKHHQFANASQSVDAQTQHFFPETDGRHLKSQYYQPNSSSATKH